MKMLNFVNLCYDDVFEVENLKVISRCNILGEPEGAFLKKIKEGSNEVFLLAIDMKGSVADPKIHFKNQEDVQKFYNFIIERLKDNSTTIDTIDVLEHNAI